MQMSHPKVKVVGYTSLSYKTRLRVLHYFVQVLSFCAAFTHRSILHETLNPQKLKMQVKSLDLGQFSCHQQKIKISILSRFTVTRLKMPEQHSQVILKFANNMFKWHTNLRAWKEKKTKTQQLYISSTIVTTVWENKSS